MYSFQQQKNMQTNKEVWQIYRTQKVKRNCPWENLDIKFTRQKL